MEGAKRRIGAPELLILIGGLSFILVLGISAFWEADIRGLHFFQAWMYVATISLTFRGSRWGHFIGVSAAGLWDYMTIFGVSFFRNGLEQLSLWFHTGHVVQPELLIAVPAWFSNLLLIIGCVWAYSRRPGKPLGDAARFLTCFALSTGFLAADMAVFQPRFLGIFPQLLHPHLP